MIIDELSVVSAHTWRNPAQIPTGDGRLAVRLLGSVEVSWRGDRVRLGGSAPTALLALLVLRSRPLRREALATDLWPEGGTASAAWLRQALWHLRRALGPAADEVIEADAEMIGLRASVDVDLDVRHFEAALRSTPPTPELAVRLYGGELVDGVTLECFASDRERLSDLYEDALAEVGARSLAAGDLRRAREVGLRLVARDPLREEGHALLIEVYGSEGSRSQVIRQYLRLRGILDGELGVEPLPETKSAYHRALARTWTRSAARASWRAPGRTRLRLTHPGRLGLPEAR